MIDKTKELVVKTKAGTYSDKMSLLYPTILKLVPIDVKKALAAASISRIFEFAISEELLFIVFNWNALIASYVASFNFLSYDICNLNVVIWPCVYTDNKSEIGNTIKTNITAKPCNFI